MTFNADTAVLAYPELHALIGGYFHQDWSSEFEGSPQAALDAYISPGGPELETAAAEIDRLIASHDDAQAADILQRFDNNYDYAYDGFTATTWLQAMRDRLRDGASR